MKKQMEINKVYPRCDAKQLVEELDKEIVKFTAQLDGHEFLHTSFNQAANFPRQHPASQQRFIFLSDIQSEAIKTSKKILKGLKKIRKNIGISEQPNLDSACPNLLQCREIFKHGYGPRLTKIVVDCIKTQIKKQEASQCSSESFSEELGSMIKKFTTLREDFEMKDHCFGRYRRSFYRRFKTITEYTNTLARCEEWEKREKVLKKAMKNFSRAKKKLNKKAR